MRFDVSVLRQLGFLIILGLAAVAVSQGQPTAPAAPAAQAPAEAQSPTTLSPTPMPEPQGAAPLRVMVNKSLLINTTERLKRISVTDPNVADALVVTPTQILVHGRAPGEVSLLIWDELERSRSFDLRVDVDVSATSEEEKRVFPDEQIEVTPSRSAIVLSGHVSTEDVAKRAGMIADAYSKNVVNVLTFGPVGAQEVLLEVKFAEVDRSAVTQLGVNLFTTGAGNTIATSTTGQFGGLGVTTSSASTSSTSKLSGRWRVPFPHRAAWPGIHGGHYFIQGVWRTPPIYAGDHAQREYPPASRPGSQQPRFHKRADDLRVYRARAEYPPGGYRIRIAGRSEFCHCRVDGQPGHQYRE